MDNGPRVTDRNEGYIDLLPSPPGPREPPTPPRNIKTAHACPPPTSTGPLPALQILPFPFLFCHLPP